MKPAVTNDLHKHTLPAPPGLIPRGTVLDVGAGIRPMNWYRPKHHICVEPYGPYAERLREKGFEVIQQTALEALQKIAVRSVGAIYLLDVIEHMTRAEGAEVLRQALRIDPWQIAVFTPHGFVEQHGDAWGLGGEEWQEHRSGWTAKDFQGWEISYVGNAFFAVRTRR
jgi:hypothetical protein